MMTSKRTRSGKPIVITSSRWCAYAAASVASAFTCANTEAAIHYSGKIDLGFGIFKDRSVHFKLDRPGDSFFLQHSDDLSGRRSYSGFARFGITGLAGASFAGFLNTATRYGCSSMEVFYVSKLPRNELISGRAFTAAPYGFMAGFGSICGFSFGQWATSPDHGFIGFKFNNGNGDQYGWIRIRMFGSQQFHPFQLVDYAYADPGESIRAGQRSGNETVSEEDDEVIPTEGSLGVVALGAAGLLAWRKRRSRGRG